MTADEYAEIISGLFHNTLIDHQGIKLLAAGGGHARAELPMSPAVTQPTGLFHAGAIIALADTTATAAALAETDPEATGAAALFPLAIQLSSNLMRKAS